MRDEARAIMTAGIDAEICVLGGGPAGAVVARRLAQLGHHAVLVDRTADETEEEPRAESLAPSILPIVDSLQLRGDIEAAVFCRESRALLRWHSAVLEKSFAAASSLLVERACFDRLLRRAAARSGVRLIGPAKAQAPQRLASGGWLVPVTASKGSTAIKAAFLVDARGKRHHGRSHAAPLTAAISALWAACDRSLAETRIEAGHDAWFWGSPVPRSRYVATIFLDSERVAGTAGANRAQLYRQLLSRSHLLKDLVQGDMIGPIRVRDATPRISPDPVGHDFIRVGEAAVAIDPLSSQGIQEAFLAAIQASAAVHTILTPGCDPTPALEFYRERRQTVAARSRLTAARFYRAHTDRSSLWMRRSSAAEEAATDHRRQTRTGTAPPSGLRLSQALRIVEAPVLSGAFIRRAPALSHPCLERPVAYFGGVALAPLVEDAGGASTADQILLRWTRRMPPETARSIMDWMWTVGILDPQAGATHDPTPASR
jgi:flavin-dependent dehydrogenase